MFIELPRIQRSATHQTAIHIRAGKQRRGIAVVDAAAIEHLQPVGHRRIERPNPRADRSCASTAHPPASRFYRYRSPTPAHTRPSPVATSRHPSCATTASSCASHDLLGTSVVAFCRRLANAQDRHQPGPHAAANFARRSHRVSPNQRRRSEWPTNTCVAAKVIHHFRRNFTGEGARRFGMDVLRADRQPLPFVRCDHCRQIRKRREHQRHRCSATSADTSSSSSLRSCAVEPCIFQLPATTGRRTDRTSQRSVGSKMAGNGKQRGRPAQRRRRIRRRCDRAHHRRQFVGQAQNLRCDPGLRPSRAPAARFRTGAAERARVPAKC